MTFRDLRLGTKQAVGFGFILVVMAGVSLFAIYQMQALRKDIEDINSVWLQRAVVSSSLNLDASALRTNQLQHAFATDPAQKQVYVDTLAGLIDEIIDRIDAGKETYLNREDAAAEDPRYAERAEQLFSEIDASWEQYLDHSLRYLVLFDERRDQEAIDLLNGDAGVVFRTFSANLAALVQLNEDSASEAARRAKRTFRTTRNRILILLIITIVLSGILAARLARFITIPVRQLVNAARKVAGGDFAVRVESLSKDEIGKLTQSFNWMTKSLKAQQEDLRAANAELQDQKNELEQTLHRLENTQEQLVMQEKMASLGHLTAGIAHEIKNPLNFVNNFAQLSVELADDLDDELAASLDKTVAEVRPGLAELLGDLKLNARRINDHGRRADSIVRSMLEHSRSVPVERRVTDVNALVEEYLNLAYHGMRASQPDFNAAVERDLDPAAPALPLMPQDMGRVLLNLLNNAFYAVRQKAGSTDGPYEPRVTVRTRALDGRVEIRVQDNGDGVPAASRDHIFEPFFTTKPTGSGNTGLGLSLSYDIVTQGHDGTLTVESTEGEGATFVITLPRPKTPEQGTGA